MAEEPDGPPREGNGSSADLERLLEERARLEDRIRRDFTRTITVMFTDFKGSTAIAETEGDMASRLLIKRHHDLLFPILQANRGVLVKTMGDGTLSWFDEARDGVAAAVAFQLSLKEFNRSRPGKTPIEVRIGLNTGRGIVEANDVFGDAVNVASRFEALASAGEICISESCCDALGDREGFRCLFWKMVELKGKSGRHKAFRVHWDPEEKAQEPPREGTDPAGPTQRPATPPGATPPPHTALPRGYAAGLRSPLLYRPVPSEQRRRPDTAWIQEEREALARATEEISGLAIRRGDTRRFAGGAYRVKDDIVVERGGVLVLENARLFFHESAGIVASGAVRAKGTLFGAIDSAQGWRNVSLDPSEERMSLFERCTFRFGRGRIFSSLPALPGEGDARIQGSYLYGGGLLLRGGCGKSVPVNECTFHRCSAHEGGGAMLLGSRAALSGCAFEQCSAGAAGGGVVLIGGAPELRNCSFKECTAALGGGGAFLRSSGGTLDGCAFERCATGYLHGGGLYCAESSPTVMGCRFTGCRAAREAGGFYRDEASSPRVGNATYSGCVPSDSNASPPGPAVRGGIGRFL